MAVEHIAIDWSGAKTGAHRKIYLARCVNGRLVELAKGLSREQVIARVVEAANDVRNVVVGLDFAFSLPLWYVGNLGVTRCEQLWKHVDENGEGWLKKCEPPFWGLPGRRKPSGLEAEYRKTEQDVGSVNGIKPKSVFQIGGAGAVGTGSLRGMPFLLRLRNAGFSIWPFEPFCLPGVVEIYPRALTGEVRKSNRDQREQYLRRRFPRLVGNLLDTAYDSEDAFDAAVSALVMSEYLKDPLSQLSFVEDQWTRLEGRIWVPALLSRP